MNLEIRLRYSVAVESAYRGTGKSDHTPCRHQIDRPGHDGFLPSTGVSANQRGMTISKYLSKTPWFLLFIVGICCGLYLKLLWIGRAFYSFHF